MVDLIKIPPSQFQDTSTTTNTGKETVTNLVVDLTLAVNGLVDVMITVDALKGVASILEAFGTALTTTLDCFGTGMGIVASALGVAAQDFTTLDGNLAKMFTQLDNQLPYYEGYETPGLNLPKILVPPAVTSGHYTLTTTTITVKAPTAKAPGNTNFWGNVGNAFSSGWNSVSQFASQHKALLIGVGTAVAVVGLVLLTPVTFGASDVAAGALVGTEVGVEGASVVAGDVAATSAADAAATTATDAAASDVAATSTSLPVEPEVPNNILQFPGSTTPPVEPEVPNNILQFPGSAAPDVPASAPGAASIFKAA